MNSTPLPQRIQGPAEIDVLLAENLPKAFTYRLQAGQEAPVGAWVLAPFGKRQSVGVVMGPSTAQLNPAKLKNLVAILDLPPLTPHLLQFIEKLSEYCVAPIGAVLAMVTGGGKTLAPIKRARKPHSATPAPAQKPRLSDAQTSAAEQLKTMVQSATFHAVLLDGVTGSGKTEVYCEAIDAAMLAGKQALLLLPEISLTTQILDRLTARFGFAPALWHSQQSPGKRKEIWRGVAEGRIPLVIGARSALFLPFADLGVLIVDEEQDGSYKQEEGVIYHARDMAVLRAKLEQIPVILSSATPSIETMVNVRAGRYQHLTLPERHGTAIPPHIHLIDLKTEPMARQSWLSPSLQQAMRGALDKGEQILLYLNRRGYAPLTLCRQCGTRLGCPQCSSWLVEHRGQGQHRLLCHHCDYAAPYPSTCPHCGAKDQLAACGPGIERLDEEVARLFPNARRAILASDTQNNLAALQGVVGAMEQGTIDILIGTQMSAKGYHFPRLTLVGVIDGDLGLQGGDLRAAERTFQMLYQVAGRSGRAADNGHVYIQTVQPQHLVMQCLTLHDRDKLLSILIKEREKYHMPPFSRLVTLILSGTDIKAVEQLAQQLARSIPSQPGLTVLGPSPAPFALLRGRHRVRFLLNADKQFPLQGFIKGWLGSTKIPKAIRTHIDIDPQSFV